MTIVSKSMRERVKHLEEGEEWRTAFRSSSLQVGFLLKLSRPMLEYLCAVADDVTWDRGLYWGEGTTENFLATSASLVKRGLIRRKSPKLVDAQLHGKNRVADRRFQFDELTPAGKAVVELVKLAGVFVEADAAIEKRHERRPGKTKA
jgi:hypothetical protein